jgi:L-2-hydroxyglutarate oxidase LhgO
MKSIGIIGAGISSLTMAVQLSRMMKQSAIKHNIKIYER